MDGPARPVPGKWGLSSPFRRQQAMKATTGGTKIPPAAPPRATDPLAAAISRAGWVASVDGPGVRGTGPERLAAAGMAPDRPLPAAGDEIPAGPTATRWAGTQRQPLRAYPMAVDPDVAGPAPAPIPAPLSRRAVGATTTHGGGEATCTSTNRGYRQGLAPRELAVSLRSISDRPGVPKQPHTCPRRSSVDLQSGSGTARRTAVRQQALAIDDEDVHPERPMRPEDDRLLDVAGTRRA
jgi:hypothetical protein